MMMKCLDTYILVEICNGNPRFVPFLNQEIIIPNLIMAEFHGDLYRKYGLKTADYWHRRLASICKPVSIDILLKAVKYRIDNKKQRLSFFDCVGYIFAKEQGIQFVTRDKEFKTKKGVEFIPK
jgi:predicted nucleic acid-binding protein